MIRTTIFYRGNNKYITTITLNVEVYNNNKEIMNEFDINSLQTISKTLGLNLSFLFYNIAIQLHFITNPKVLITFICGHNPTGENNIILKSFHTQ